MTEKHTTDVPNTEGISGTADGRIILIPQPSDDPLDPLNWSWSSKHGVLMAVSFGALLTDWGIAWGTTLFETQAVYWGMSVSAVANSVSGANFLQGVGGVLVVPITQRCGRLPVLFWSQILSCATVIAAALSPGYAGFAAARTLQGLFSTAPQVIGLSIIHDMFFFHEHARKIGIWGWCFVTGPYIGPMISALLNKQISWRANFGVLAALYFLSATVVLIFGRETLYDRNSNLRITDDGSLHARIQHLTGIAGFRATGRPTLWAGLRHTFSISIRPHIFAVSAPYYMLTFMWSIGLVNTITQFETPSPYFFSSTAIALFYFSPIIGSIIGDVWGNFFNDFLSNRYIRKHDGLYEPEARLWAIWPATFFAAGSLVLIGQVLQHGLSWVGLAFGWGMFSMAVLAATVAISAYVLDCFPHHAAQAASIVNFWRTTGGFCVVYFQSDWVARSGAGITFGCQAAICVFAFLFVVMAQVCGRGWRVRFPPPTSEN
ncbi:major facilitator superfamily domain-containing protein [Calycina marina]|uniref:Major facilitator superfamily domain-containing protein n=1 Tax=Calycina marina TaxID=1763456 RepID=A0A9P8CDT1_9HELO|nr:major facilitator superfamily domain-containing protein [Calycina marina]